MPFVYSTLTAGQSYAEYRKDVAPDLNQVSKKVHIKGGNNVADKRLFTPYSGIVTEVSDEDAEFLKNHPVFKIHQSNGFVRIDANKKDPEKVVTSTAMELRDESAPETPATLEEKGANIKADAEKKK